MKEKIKINEPFGHAIAVVIDKLREQGFGVVSQLNMHETFKNKIGRDFKKYTILGVCNPELAYQALSDDPNIGLLLPCNVTVEEDGDQNSIVRFIDPERMLEMGGKMDSVLEEMGRDAKERLVRAQNQLTDNR